MHSMPKSGALECRVTVGDPDNGDGPAVLPLQDKLHAPDMLRSNAPRPPRSPVVSESMRQ